jgi:hypothetical protein
MYLTQATTHIHGEVEARTDKPQLSGEECCSIFRLYHSPSVRIGIKIISLNFIASEYIQLISFLCNACLLINPAL